MYPLLQQPPAMPYHGMFIRKNTCAMPYQSMFIRKITCCMTNQNQTHQQQRYASLRINSARDKVIDFGKHKGKMLGTLPSKYLKWVSENLRARDFEKWAILADQVLEDPIYKDRIEWEYALNVLEGNDKSFRSTEPASSRLQKISERFGWNFLDKVGWSKVKFDLLGTSYGGRIPRLADASEPNLPPATTKGDGSASEPNLPTATISTTRSKRIERREKLKMRSRTTHEPQQQQHNVVPAADIKQVAKDDTVAAVNPFPGRQALFRKAINHRSQS